MLDKAAAIAYRTLVQPASSKPSSSQYLHEQQHVEGRPRTELQDGLLHQWTKEHVYYELAADFELLDFLRLCMGSAMVPIQTRTYGRGSSVPAHADTSFADTLPRRGRMVGTILALEDFRPEAGPTFYIPGTHKLSQWDHLALGLINAPAGMRQGVDFNLTDYLRAAAEANRVNNMSYITYARTLQRIIDERGWLRKSALLKRGDVLVWASSLIHGSQPLADFNSTRLSMSAHFLDIDQSERWNPMGSKDGHMASYGAVPGRALSQSALIIANHATWDYHHYLKEKYEEGKAKQAGARGHASTSSA